MRIKRAALIGAGAVGSWFIPGLGMVLGKNFYVIASGERADRLRTEGIVINGRVYDGDNLNIRTAEEAGALGVDFDTAENYKLDYDTGKLDDRVKSKIETALSRNISVWLTGVEVALEEFENVGCLPRDILLCGGGASLSLLQETLAISDWYQGLPFSRRPVIHLIDVAELPDLIIEEEQNLLDHSFATAIGLLRVGVDTLAGAPKQNKLKAKIDKLLQN